MGFNFKFVRIVILKSFAIQAELDGCTGWYLNAQILLAQLI